jgi:glycerol-3-phosphate dehydrogenase
MFERNHHILESASGRNSGIICTGVDAPTGSLERTLIRDSISSIREFCREMSVPMRECGSLVCMWPWDKDCNDESKIDMNSDEYDDSRNQKLKEVLKESHDAGDTDASYLDTRTVLDLEPSLSSECAGVLFIYQEK